MRYIASVSYGKDSLAQLEVIHRHGLPLTDIVTADIWAAPGIPAYLPDLVDFRERIDREILERYGIPVTHVRAEKSFIDYFYREMTARSKYTDLWGWPPAFGHWCMNYLKLRPIKKYFDGLDYVEWVGIAADEPARRAQLNERKRSALVEHGVTEAQAMDICRELGWVSPTYLHSVRDGCWFCPCQGIDQLRRLYNDFPDYWQLMMAWDKATKKRFKIDHTLAEYDKRFRLENEGKVPIGRGFKWEMLNQENEKQLSIFDTEGRAKEGEHER